MKYDNQMKEAANEKTFHWVTAMDAIYLRLYKQDSALIPV